MTSQLCTFRLGGLRLGVPVERVQEVLRQQHMTRVPRADSVVAGLMNLRGQIVTAINLWRRLGVEPSEGREWMNVIIRAEDCIVSLLVDEISDVMEVEDSQFEMAPTTLRDGVRPFIAGVYKQQEGLLLLLDTERVLAVSEDDSAAIPPVTPVVLQG